MHNWLEQLNDEQRLAVSIIDQPLRIIAGAGSGKTRVITTKIAYLINEHKIAGNRILAMTFTNKAAREMRERVIKMLDFDVDSAKNLPIISTFHSWCSRVLRIEYAAAGLKPNFLIIGQDDQKVIIKEAIKALNITISIDPKAFNSITLSRIDDWKNSIITPEEALNESNEIDEMNYAKIYQYYQKILLDNNSIDFNDLQLYVFQMFLKNEDILKKWQSRYDYLLIDEYQDTNDLQFRLIKLLNGNRNGLTVVGDPDQTIYSWRGADISIINNFITAFSNSKSVTLKQNYRSTQEILNLANDFITNNKNRVVKEIFSNKDRGDKVEVKEAFTTIAEARYVSSKIQDLIKDGYDYKDIFILYRTNAWSRAFEEEFWHQRIPFQLIGGMKFRERRVIKDIIAYLKMLLSQDEFHTRRVLSRIKGIGNVTIQKIVDLAQETGVTVMQLLIDKERLIHRVTKNLDFLQPILIQALQMVNDNYGVYEITKFLLTETKYEENIKAIGGIQAQDDLDNIAAFYDQMKIFDQDFKNEYTDESISCLATFLQEESLSSENDINDEESAVNRVTLLTIHSAKGLENKIVFIVGVNKDVFPNRRSLTSLSNLEEERRTLYVALTRAQERLFISYVKGEFSYISKGELGPSRFIQELNKDLYNFQGGVFVSKTGKMVEISDTSQSRSVVHTQLINDKGYQENDLVNHKVYGDGIILRNMKGQLQIQFSNSTYGTISIAVNNAMLSKK